MYAPIQVNGRVLLVDLPQGDDPQGDGWWIGLTPADQPGCDRYNEGRHPPERLKREVWKDYATG